MKKFLYLPWILMCFFARGQYTEVINSRFPGVSESPYGVGTKVYQIETNYFRNYDFAPDFFTTDRSSGLNVYLRTSLFSEKLEVNLDTDFRTDHMLVNPIFETGYDTRGFGKLNFSLKYLWYKPTYKDPAKEIRSWKKKWAFDWNRLIPAVALEAGLETNFVSEAYRLPGIGPRVALLLQQDFDDWTTLVTDVYAEHILYDTYRKIGVVSALTYSIGDRISIFAEGQMDFFQRENKYYLGVGGAYLLNMNLQAGVHIRSEVRTDYLNMYATVGLSWRLDKHKDKVKKKKYVTEQRVEYKKKGFLSGLFSKKGRRGRIPKKKHYRKKRKKGERRSRESVRKQKPRRKRHRHTQRRTRERRHRHSRRRE